MTGKKIIIGRGKSRNPKWLQATIPEKMLRELLENHLEDYSGHKYVRVNINVNPEAVADKFGKIKDVEISLDQWKPSGERKPIEDEYTFHDNVVKQSGENFQSKEQSADIPF